MALTKLFTLRVDVPLSAIDCLMDVVPEKAVSQSAFAKDVNDRRQDPLWVLEAHYKDKPDATAFKMACEILATSMSHAPYPIEWGEVTTKGWVEKNQASYAPIPAGRFSIHGPRDRHLCQKPKLGIEMDISCAFGTGEHPTTFGCLMALQQQKKNKTCLRVLDIGTGSAILAIAAAKLWVSRVYAGEIDAASVLAGKDNIKRNGKAHAIKIYQSAGFRHKALRQAGPYDIILSNIFARPLIRLAPEMKKHLKRNGRLILAGFLHENANWVKKAYALQGIFLDRRLIFGGWSILILRKK